MPIIYLFRRPSLLHGGTTDVAVTAATVTKEFVQVAAVAARIDRDRRPHQIL